MNITWPSSDSALLLWSQLLLTWVVALYYAGRTSSIWGRVYVTTPDNWWAPAIPRFFLLFLVPFLLHGWNFLSAFLLAIVAFLLALALTYARERGNEAWRTRGAELELGVTGAYVLLAALLVGDQQMRPLLAIVKLPLSESRIAALCFSAAIMLFLIRGGTQVVRAILNKAGSLPTVQPQSDKIDEVEYNRGRLIGSIERLLLAGMVAAGSYAGLGFLIAAKGLVRSKDLEKHDFAEYFLIGTLTSTALAMIAGGLLRLIFLSLW